MRKLILLFFFVSSALWLHAKDFTRYVSPLVGTQSTFELSTGNTYPAIARPWGMNSGLLRRVRWVTAGIRLYREQDPWFQADTPAQSLD